jgi:hypothetical protein
LPIDQLGAALLASAWPETSVRVAVLAIAFAAACAIATIVLAVVDRAALARTRPLAERESRDQPTPPRATSDRQMRSAVDVRRMGQATSEHAVASGVRVGTVTRPPAAVQIPASPALQPQPVGSRDATSPLLDSDVREEPKSTLVLEFAGMARPARVRVRLFDAALDEEGTRGARRRAVPRASVRVDQRTGRRRGHESRSRPAHGAWKDTRDRGRCRSRARRRVATGEARARPGTRLVRRGGVRHRVTSRSRHGREHRRRRRCHPRGIEPVRCNGARRLRRPRSRGRAVAVVVGGGEGGI